MKVNEIPEYSHVLLLSNMGSKESDCNALLYKIATSKKCIIVDSVVDLDASDDLSGVDFILTTNPEINSHVCVPVVYVGE